MKLELEIYTCLCETCVFAINDIIAYHDDFGDKYDHNSDAAEPYCCADMRFDTRLSTPKVLAKYGISEAEYREIASQLERGLSFGNCGHCS